jgi:signal-transduction protein with cAMP-binding, CBS, and nucleotidyltransferase domain
MISPNEARADWRRGRQPPGRDDRASERDILSGLAEHGVALLGLKASDVMTREVLTCSRGDNVQSIMRRMSRSRVRHLPVTENGRLCGMISIGDAIKHRLGEVELEENVLRDAYIAVH